MRIEHSNQSARQGLAAYKGQWATPSQRHRDISSTALQTRAGLQFVRRFARITPGVGRSSGQPRKPRWVKPPSAVTAPPTHKARLDPPRCRGSIARALRLASQPDSPSSSAQPAVVKLLSDERRATGAGSVWSVLESHDRVNRPRPRIRCLTNTAVRPSEHRRQSPLIPKDTVIWGQWSLARIACVTVWRSWPSRLLKQSRMSGKTWSAAIAELASSRMRIF